MGFDISNDGAKGIFSLNSDDTIPQPDQSVLTITDGPTTGVEESVRDFVGNPQQLVPSQTDFSVIDGVNIDDAFSFGGGFDTVKDNTLGFLGVDASLADIAKGIGLDNLFALPPLEIDTEVQPKLDPRDNVLHQYATHTYRITLGAQSLEDHQVTSEGKGIPVITTMLMSSGGARNVDNVQRDPIFNEDFYIEDLQMTTIIGSNAQGNGSNSVNITFTIVEPYAVSLIERLLALANKLDYKNYIEIPFVFKIEFVGYDDEGREIGVIPQTTKYIPFRLTYMNFVVKESGAAYQCTAIPVNHFAFNETVARLPEPVQVSAGNIEEFFNGKNKGEDGNNTRGGAVQAINQFHKRLTESSGVNTKEKPAREVADEIEIWIHPDIRKGALVTSNLSKVGMLKESTGPGGNYDPKSPVYGFKTGTNITSMIREVVKNSTFITSQLEEFERVDRENRARNNPSVQYGSPYNENLETFKKKPFINFRITSKYTMKEYDNTVGRHAYKARFEVIPSDVRARQFNDMGKMPIKSVAKDYDYLFTGNNQDIIDMDIKFDLAFYNARNANTDTAGQNSATTNDKFVAGVDRGDANQNRLDQINNKPVENHHVSARDNTSTSTKEDKQKIKSDGFWRSIMQESRGDMVTFDMEVLGDPALIKQDDILWKSDDPIDGQNPFTKNGSIKQDNGDMYIRLRFRVLDDINHETGLRNESRTIPNSTFNSKSVFDGYYRILQLDNHFVDGMFTQSLVVVRADVQEAEDEQRQENETVGSGLVNLDLGLDFGGIDFSSSAVNLESAGRGIGDWNQQYEAGLTAATSFTESQQTSFANSLDALIPDTGFDPADLDGLLDIANADTTNLDRD